MSKNDDDFEFEALLSFNQEEEATDKEAPLTQEQEASIAKIEAAGFKFNQRDGNYLRFREVGEPGSTPHRQRFITTIDKLDTVANDVRSFRNREDYRGVARDDGSYVEFLLQMPISYLRVGSYIERREWEFAESNCGHQFAATPELPTSLGVRSSGFHLTSPSGDVCMEVSAISAIADFMAANTRFYRSSSLDYTLKVLISSPSSFEASMNSAQAAADSLLFEFDVKHDLPISLLPREQVRTQGRPRRSSRKTAISFPSTHISREVAALFAFAAEASDNPPFAFFSYYQVLEYYMPLTSRRDALRRIRREMRDFSFDIANDGSVLRVLHAAERAKGLSEEDALKVLVSDCVREDKLKDFFQTAETGQHFSRNGPILGVPAVNLKATNESLAVQTAKRVYALRNRIVHAKDDPKYAETPQLLPRSTEANSLGPDVLLARFLALETIADTQD
ncbi:hypothetical protein ACFXCU_07365 [Streptomyces virginiae]|uniref:hypothetical protein n=1 Tax=Streptomyces virginiae TaxID=1961 RepID=UPI0036CCB1A6